MMVFECIQCGEIKSEMEAGALTTDGNEICMECLEVVMDESLSYNDDELPSSIFTEEEKPEEERDEKKALTDFFFNDRDEWFGI